MFTGIIEALGKVHAIETEGTNKHFDIRSDISTELKIDQSVAHNGVCLTVVAINDDIHRVTAIKETLDKSSLGNLKPGDELNLERCMLNNGRFDGHIVQGHVDQTGQVKSIVEEEGSWLFTIEHESIKGNVTVEKGSITINGISLTCFNSTDTSFTVAIIPYTYEHTNMKALKKGDTVNLEFDIVGKYVQKLMRQG
ncbi:riboflavin synthase [Fulvivirga sp. RKSG066]|uniref:riboflavin synthase n=1 Tax=Fulvivirga aurantia TaxID=2529383 RepID=UPI0012BC2B9A|nr:riboflavin synthase [Fulvivirga aurantia]MTI23215.1 riboflavin synthase [Fulvivirga aurantia]